MKTRLILLRHAASVAKEQGIVQGAGRDVPLSEAGKEDALRLAALFPYSDIDRIISSSALRARDTAAPLRKRFSKIPYEEVDALIERSKGSAEGMSKQEFATRYPDILAAWTREEDPKVLDGESYEDVERRILPIVNAHLREHVGKTLLYVGHGNVFRVLLGGMLGIPYGMRNRIALECCSLSVAEYDHDRARWSIESVNQRVLP